MPRGEDQTPPDISVGIFGFRVDRRDETHHEIRTTSPLLTLMMEDDGMWHDTNVHFDAFWLDDLASIVRMAKQHKEVQKERRRQQRKKKA